jgi:hypothetical protein
MEVTALLRSRGPVAYVLILIAETESHIRGLDDVEQGGLSIRMVAGYREAAERKILLVAEGGFVPHSLIDSSELTDSTIVRNAKKGHKGEFFIQFSFSFRRSSFRMGFLLTTRPFCSPVAWRVTP